MDILERVKRARRGDGDAYAELFAEYEGDVYRTAYAYLGNAEDALDVVQETAYRSFKSIRGLREPRYFKTWLIRIAIRCAADLYRRRRREAAWTPAHDEALVAEDEAEDIPLSLSLRTLLERLDADERQTVVLRYYGDLTIREAAETMDIPLGTAKTLLYRALAKLRRHAEEEGQDAYR